MLLKEHIAPANIILRALATPTRFQMLKFLLEHNELTAFQLMDLFFEELGIDTEVALFHLHLRTLKKCGLVTSRLDDHGINHYSLNGCGSALLQIFSTAEHLGKAVRLPEAIQEG